jgi:DNA ligase D-like protein (predicted 3'-phosphoesterase)
MSESAGRSSRRRADLDEYREKRDFDRTREPAGGARRRDGEDGALAFVIQKHAASHLHYDLRLEVDGVMRSWAVPKGPSMNPGVKRLAMQVEDHPVEYNRFEGSIPPGEYGGGTVMIWDRGIYRPDSDREAEDPNRAAARGLRAGKLTFVLEGERLRGGFTLVRTGRDPRPQWLLMKQRDDFASEKGREITARFSTSVESGRSMKAIAAAGERVWHSNRSGGDPAEREGDVPGAPAGVRPARPNPAPRLPAERGWSAEWEIPGLAIAVVRGDSVIFARGYGERTVGTGEPVDEHTLFAIASTTKAMTVAGLGMLVDEGALEWDDPVLRHLPAFQLQDPYVTRHVTLRDLLTHRTGVSRDDQVWIAAPLDRAEILRRARHLRQADGFRTGYAYNNIMYMTAGEVLAAAAGMEWDDFIASRIFGPLGMTRTTSRFAEVETRSNVTSSHVRVGGRIMAVDRRNYDALGPAGSVFSSAHDMAKWVRLQLNEGVFEGRRLLEAETLREMHRPQVVMAIDSTTERLFPSRNFSAYGLAWRMEDYHGRKVVQHTGAVNYTRTQVGLIPSEGIGVVVLANLSSSALQTALMHYVFDALLGLPATDWSRAFLSVAERSSAGSDARSRELALSRISGTAPSLPLDAYAGTYTDDLYGELRIELEDGGLVLRYAPEYVADLEHWHHDTFRVVWRSEAALAHQRLYVRVAAAEERGSPRPGRACCRSRRCSPQPRATAAS